MPSAPKVNILLVDDRPENLMALEAVLEPLHQNLVKANSGEEALRCLLDQDFAVILLDVQMDKMDGFETATLIRQRERSRNTPILFLTAFSTSDAFVFKGYALGAVDYLFKPIDSTILTAKVTVFVDLFKKTLEVKQQAAQLALINAELKTSEEKFRSLSACAPVGIFLLDNTGRCTYTNPNTQAIWGFKTQESWEEEWAKSIYPEDRDRVISEWSRCTNTTIQYADEFRIYTPDGTLRWVCVRTSPMLSEHKQLLGHVGTIEDITERKQAEAMQEKMLREQIARAEAETANRMKDEFLAILSHELRTPLNSILGWAKLLRSRKFDESVIARALETIERNAQSQSRLIEDILDVSKIIQGKLRLSVQPVNLIDLIQTVEETLRPLADAKAIQLETKIETLNALVSGDPERLQQIVWNLLSNAIKFTPDGGRVEMRLCIVNSPPKSTKYVQIQVIDTGVGIPKNFLPYVFDRFRQADSSTTRSHGGLGLGLTIVSHLIELHQGSIYAYSEGEDKGATFTINLPLLNSPEFQVLSTEPVSNQNALPTNNSALSGIKVLIVEDHFDTLEYIKMVLEQSQAKVIAIASVNEAIEYLEDFSPDVILSDIAMPGEDGYQFIRWLRDKEQNQERKTPAIALTAYARVEDRQRAMEEGFQMYLSKPVEPNDLVMAIAKLAGLVTK
jgi:PAS domain S-box-containing protein